MTDPVAIANSFNDYFINVGKSLAHKAFSMYFKTQFVNFYRVECNLANCFVCENSN